MEALPIEKELAKIDSVLHLPEEKDDFMLLHDMAKQKIKQKQRKQVTTEPNEKHMMKSQS